MSKIKELKGQNGIIMLHETFIEISRKSFGGFISQGGSSGVRRLYLKDISGVEYKRPNMMSNGYIKILVSGTEESNAKVGFWGSSKESMKDQNTIVLRAFTKAKSSEADEMYNLIMKYHANAKNASSNATQPSKMDELAKMAEMMKAGILTEEEFQQEKNKLLNN